MIVFDDDNLIDVNVSKVEKTESATMLELSKYHCKKLLKFDHKRLTQVLKLPKIANEVANKVASQEKQKLDLIVLPDINESNSISKAQGNDLGLQKKKISEEKDVKSKIPRFKHLDGKKDFAKIFAGVNVER